METIGIILIIYWSGFAVAWAIAAYNIRKYKTNDGPLPAAVWSWIVVVLYCTVIMLERPIKAVIKFFKNLSE